MASTSDVPEVTLWKTNKEKEMYEDFANLYAIIKTTEKLEKAFVRSTISEADYEPACLNLITQFRSLRNSIKEMVPDWERFVVTYKMDCPAAVHRLKVGVPATMEHKLSAPSKNDAVAVAETVQHYITTMDSLKLNMVAVDQVHPLLTDLLGSLNRVQQLPPDFEGKVKVKDWLTKLYNMGASEELNDSEARQLLFDLESSYTAFMNSLPKGR
eukprot:TRINITY_DN22995_c0_g1_i1.p1 TRINITY_DN22995_c0_g1~~TRINITY_DN22995_c0_g1_i1.p1  ORF type:complete len:230 (-),score=52.33 TRINITY_DN22995_c0_g1_i1:523-1161(-)